ncbi:hypothetical protein QU862_20320 [Escherichia coli]|nr:hypothetical protein [Escherichia coli]
MGQLAGHRMRILRIFSLAKMGQNAAKGAKMGQKKSGLSWLIVVADNV